MKRLRVLFLLIFCVFSTRQAAAHATEDLAPGWARSNEIFANPNASFFQDVNSTWVPNDGPPLRDRLMDAADAARVRQEYDDMARAHELRKAYDIEDQNSEMQYMEQRSGFTMYVLRNIVSYQVTENIKEAERNSSEVRTFRKVHESVGAVAKGEAAMDMSSNVKFGTNANFPAQRGGVWMNSPLVNASVNVVVGKPWSYDPWTFQKADDSGRNEKYSVNVNRQLPFDVRGSVTYGATSTRVTGLLSKKLTPHWTAEVLAIRAQDKERAAMPLGREETVQLLYGISF